MKITAIVEALVNAGATPEMILAAVRSAEDQKDAAADASRAKARERVARWREAHQNGQSNVTERSVTSHNAPQRLVSERVPVEDNPSSSEKEQKEESKKVARSTRLSSDWTLPNDWRDDGRKVGLSESRIDEEAIAMRDWSLSAPKGIKNDWRAAWRGWCRRAAKEGLARAGPRSRQAPMDHFTNYASEINGQERDDRSLGGDWDDAPGLPIRTIEHHG